MLYLQDNRNGHLYGSHVVAAIKRVRALAQKGEGGYDMRQEMASFVGKLSYREMCAVLKEQKGWRQARDFFAWMKLQVGHCLCWLLFGLSIWSLGFCFCFFLFGNILVVLGFGGFKVRFCEFPGMVKSVRLWMCAHFFLKKRVFLLFLLG